MKDKKVDYQRKKFFYLYLIEGFVLGLLIEIINGARNNPVGIGVIVFCILMILYYNSFPVKQK